MMSVVGALSPKENRLSIVIQIGIAVRGWRVLVAVLSAVGNHCAVRTALVDTISILLVDRSLHRYAMPVLLDADTTFFQLGFTKAAIES
jgi:hypothetical protein